jgi:uncharacterized protein (TIGR03905 family)
MFTYIPEQVCAKKMVLKIDKDIIKNVEIIGGCPGSAVGMARLIAGMNIQEALKRLKGVPCGSRDTSCPDQLSQALEAYINKD